METDQLTVAEAATQGTQRRTGHPPGERHRTRRHDPSVRHGSAGIRYPARRNDRANEHNR